MKGPGIFLAQFIGKSAPFDSLSGLATWAAEQGYEAIQVPTHLPEIFNLQLAATSDTYCDEVSGTLADAGIVISELSTHIQGQLLAVHPAYAPLFDQFAPESVRGNDVERTQWAQSQLLLAAKASAALGLDGHASFSGSLLWPYVYPWPAQPQGLVEDGFKELAQRWLPVLNAFEDAGTDVCFELHPSEDLHDGVSFERFLDAVNNHPRANILYDPSHLLLQHIDYLGFIDVYKDRIKAFHVKDAEFNQSPRSGVYGGYQNWLERPGRFRSLGDGQVNFSSIFSKLTQYGFSAWAVLEWECCLKSSGQGAKEGADFIRRHLIERSSKSFDDFAAVKTNAELNAELLGLSKKT